MTILAKDNFAEYIRVLMRDRAELNRLLSREETSDSTIFKCTEQAISLWNSYPPTDVYTVSITSSGSSTELVTNPSTGEQELATGSVYVVMYPTNGKALLAQAVIIEILKSIIFLRARNNLQYQDGSIGVNEEAGPLQADMQILNMMQQEFQTRLNQAKYKSNLELLLDSVGGAASDYSLMVSYNYLGGHAFYI